MSDDDKANFWRDMKTKSGSAAQEEFVLHILGNKIIESRISGSKGKYLPLGAYAVLGYDTKNIQEKCRDTIEHEVLGKCYRVDITYMDKKKEIQRIREEILKSVQERKGKQNPPPSVVDPGVPALNGKGGKGGGKTNPKVPPVTAIVCTKKMNADAVKIMAKVSPILFSARANLANKKIKMLPDVHIKQLKEVVKKLATLESQAQATVSKQVVLAVAMADVAAEIKPLTDHNQLVTSLLASL